MLCNKQTDTKAWSLRIHLTSQSLIQELTNKFTGIQTDSPALCDFCRSHTQRLVKTKKLLTNTDIILVLNKNDVQKFENKVIIPLSIETNTPPLLISHQNTSQQTEHYYLHATINHHGQQHTSGHYTYSQIDILKGIITTIDGSKISGTPLVTNDTSNSLIVKDPYIVIYKYKELSSIPKPSQNTKTIKAYDDSTMIKPKKGRPTQKKPPKPDPNQKSLLLFFKTNVNETPQQNTQSHNTTDRYDTISILYSNIRSIKANKLQLETYIERHQPKIVALTKTWQKESYPPLKLKQDHYTIIEKKKNQSGWRWTCSTCR